MKFSVKSFIVACVIIVLVTASGISIYYYPQAYDEFFSVFVKDPLWASVLVTIVLVAMNAYYAWQVRQSIHEMEKARKAEFTPHVRAELFFLGPIFLMLKVTNFGKGPAINVKAQIAFFPSKEKRPWDEAIMSPNESIRILLPDGNINRVCETSAKIIVSGECKDIFGQAFKIYDEMNTKEFIDQATKLQPILEENLNTIVKEIKDELRGVKDEIRNIRTRLERNHD